MKYELMALVNQIGREEYVNGHDYMQVRMEKLYDRIAEGNVKPYPEEVGSAIFEQYFEHIQQAYMPIELPEENKAHNPNYVKPFFVDPEELIEVDNSKGMDDFIFELMDLLAIKRPKNFFQDNTRSRQVLIKNAIRELQKAVRGGGTDFFR